MAVCKASSKLPAWAGCFLLAALTPCDAALAACLPHTAAMRGELRLVSTRHPNGQPIEALQLVLRPAVCVQVPSSTGRPATLQVNALQLFVQPPVSDQLKARLGSMVTARGDIDEPHTAWHIGDAVMFGAVILRIED
jgi:hypothetical protein